MPGCATHTLLPETTSFFEGARGGLDLTACGQTATGYFTVKAAPLGAPAQQVALTVKYPGATIIKPE
jgi:hypothetical protein